jgi:hypothetical protein
MRGTSSIRTRARSLSSLALVLVLAVLAGCGGGDGTQTLSKAEVIKTGDEICRDADKAKTKAFYAYAKEHPTAASGSKSERKELLVAIGLPPLEEELEKLSGLEPESGASEYKAILTAFETGISEAKANPFSITNEATSPLKQANQLAKEFGFRECSSL